jgi:ketosteroid isomerase-like protein
VREHPNVALVRRLVSGFRDGDLDSIDALIASDLIWHFPGHSGRLAGDHRGRDEVLQFLVDVVALTAGSFDFDVIDVLANDRRAIVLFRGRATREGRELNNPTCLSMKLRAGQIVELWEFVWNLYAVDEFWS